MKEYYIEVNDAYYALLKKEMLSIVDESFFSRIEDELLVIKNNNLCRLFWYLYLTNKDNRLIIICKGYLSNFYLSYLVGINLINPIEYSLPYELENKISLSLLISDFERLLLLFSLQDMSETVLVKVGYKEVDPNIDKFNNQYFMFLPTDYFPRDLLFKYNKDYYLFETEREYKDLDEYEGINLMREDVLDDLKVEEINKFKPSNYVIDFKFIKKNKYELDLYEILKPKKFMDLVKIESLGHGTDVWEKQEKLFKDGVVNLDSLISNREDVYAYLINHHISKKESIEITKFIATGKRFDYNNKKEWKKYKKLLNENCDDWFIDVISSIRYLFFRGEAIQLFLARVLNEKQM